jgi:hypothetical protein
LGAFLGRFVLTVAFWLIALTANYTVLERLLHVRKNTRPVELDPSQ